MIGRVGMMVAMVALASGCDVDVETEEALGESESAIKAGMLDAPTLTVLAAGEGTTTLLVCAGRSGAPGGFAIQAAPSSSIVDGAWPDDDGLSCEAGFSGNHASDYRLVAGECIVVELVADARGECELACEDGSSYRAFAQAVPRRYRSAWSDTSAAKCSSAANERPTLVDVYEYVR